jgi:hypothetical protein
MIQDSILQVFKGRITGNQIQLKVCPFCGNPKYNFEISLLPLPKYGNKRVFSCWACNVSGTLENFCKRFNIPYTSTPSIPRNIELPKTSSDDIQLPESFTLINPANPTSVYETNALKYLYHRNITNDTIVKFHVGFCYAGRFESRLIFPVYENDKLIYFTSRGYWYKENAGALHPNIPKNGILYGFNRFLKNAVIVEGVFDVLSLFQLGYYGIALLGKKIQKEQIRKILSSRLENIKILLDADTTIKERMDIYHKLNMPGKKVQIVDLPHGDPNSFDQRELKKLLDNS